MTRHKLGTLCSVVTKGTTPTSIGLKFEESGVPFLRIQNLRDLTVSLDSCLYISADTHEALRRSKINAGDFLITIAGTIGRVAIVPDDFPECNCNQAVAILRFDRTKLLPRYLMHWFSTNDALNQIRGKEVTATISNLSLSQIKELEIPLPPLEEQKRIAAILGKADAIRQKRKQAIDLADEFLRSVFLDMFGDPVVNPRGWKQVTLSTLSEKILNGTTPKGGSNVYVEKGIAFLRSQNVWKKRIDLDDIVCLDDETHAKMSKSSLKHKDILITKTGRINTENSSLGRAAIYYGKDDEANINGHVYLVRLKPDHVHEFIEFILTTKEYRDHIRSVCVGGIDKRQLNKNHIEDFPIICPPSNEQERFVKILHQSQKVLDNYKEQLGEAQNNFFALSQKAFSGQL